MNTTPTLSSLRAGTAAAAMCLGALVMSHSAEAGGTLRVGNVGEPETLDPHHVAGTWENRIVGDMLIGLTTEAADGTATPGAAERWTISNDGITYTFKLREHNWSDGTPVTAGDFVFALRRILAPETAAKYASLLYPIKNAKALNAAEMHGMENLGVRALDDRTLEITLEAPTPYFIEQLTHYTACPVPEHVVRQYGAHWIKPQNMVVNGPYKLREWVPNAHVTLDKNPAFYDADNVSIDTVIFYPTEDRGALQKRFRAGEVDMARDFASEQIDWLRKNLAQETKIAPYLGIYYYTINNNRPPLDDVRVRQALSMVIDREIITDKVLKTGELPAYSFVPPGTANYGEPSYVTWKSTDMAERVEQAKALLAEAGYGTDKPLAITLSYNTSENHKRIAVAVAAMWKKALGVKTELHNREVKVHYDRLEQNDFDIARAGWIADYNDPQNFLFLMETSSDTLNYARYSNSEFDALMTQASRTVDLDERAALLAKAETIAMRDQPVIPIYYYVSKNLISQRVQGVVPNTKDIYRTRFLSLRD